MNCEEITQKIGIAKLIADEIKNINPDEITSNLDKYLGLKKEYENLRILIENSEPQQYLIREQIAKELNFNYVGMLSGGVYRGVRGRGAGKEEYLINKQGDKVIFGPFVFKGDSGEGKYLVFEYYDSTNNPRDDNATGRFLCIDKDGKIIHVLGEEDGKTNPMHIPTGGFLYSTEPTLLIYNDPSTRQRSKFSYLKPNGDIILERKHLEDSPNAFSEGYVWIKKPNGTQVLYNDSGVVMATVSGFYSIDRVINGKSLALKKMGGDADVYSIDTNGAIEDLGIKIDSSVLPQRRGDYFVAGKSNKKYYFTISGEILNIPGKPEYDNINEKEGIFKIYFAFGSTRLIDSKGQDIFNKTFEGASQFSEGLISVVMEGGNSGYLDIDGNFIKPKTDKSIYNMHDFKNNIAIIEDTDGFFTIDKAGNDLFKGKRFTGLDDVGQGVFRAKDTNPEQDFYVKTNGERIF